MAAVYRRPNLPITLSISLRYGLMFVSTAFLIRWHRGAECESILFPVVFFLLLFLPDLNHPLRLRVSTPYLSDTGFRFLSELTGGPVIL